jgi:hypothetical protein
MVGAPERLPAFGARTLPTVSQHQWFRTYMTESPALIE